MKQSPYQNKNGAIEDIRDNWKVKEKLSPTTATFDLIHMTPSNNAIRIVRVCIQRFLVVLSTIKACRTFRDVGVNPGKRCRGWPAMYAEMARIP